MRQNLFAEFICWPERAGPVHTGGACTGDARAEAFVFVLSLFFGGGLVEDRSSWLAE